MWMVPKQPKQQWTGRGRRLNTQLLGRHVLSLAAKCGKSEDFIRHVSERVLHKTPEALVRLLHTPSGMGFNATDVNMKVDY